MSDHHPIEDTKDKKDTAETLMQVIAKGDLGSLKTLLESGLAPLLNAQGRLPEIIPPKTLSGEYSPGHLPVEETPLTYALNPSHPLTAEQRLAIVQLLVHHKLVPNQANSLGETPIMLATKQNDPKIIDFLLAQNVDNLVVRLQTAAQQQKALEQKRLREHTGGAEVSETAKNLGNVVEEAPDNLFLNDPTQIAKLSDLIYRTSKIMLSDHNTHRNIFNEGSKLPTIFTSYKFKIPDHFTLPFLGGEKIKKIKVLTGNITEDASDLLADDRTSLRDMQFLTEYDPISHRNIVVQITLDNGEKEILTIQTKEDANILQQILNEFAFKEEAFIAPEPAYTAKQWEFESSSPYIAETRKFYRAYLHPKIMKDIRKNIDQHKEKDAVIFEIGCGEGNLAIKMFDEFATPANEIHVVGADLVQANIVNAKKKVIDSNIKGDSDIEFYQANSVTLLDELAKQGCFEKLEKLQAEYSKKHGGHRMPLYIASSGALNRLVLNDTFESCRVMQNIYRLQPELMAVSGITETLLNQHILKKVGFKTLHRSEDFDEGGGNYYKIKPQTHESLGAYYNHQLIRKPNQLDLSMSPDPLNIIKKIDPILLSNISVLDISHAYFKDQQEVESFLKLISESCPKLNQVVYDFHFPEDARLFSSNFFDADPGNTLMSKIKANRIEHEQDIAFTKKFVARAIQPAYLTMRTAGSSPTTGPTTAPSTGPTTGPTTERPERPITPKEGGTPPSL